MNLKAVLKSLFAKKPPEPRCVHLHEHYWVCYEYDGVKGSVVWCDEEVRKSCSHFKPRETKGESD